MTTIYIDPIGTTTSLSITSTIEDVKTVDNDTLTTTLATAITTAVMNPVYANCDITNKYLDSLTDEELIAMEHRLEEKEDNYSVRVGHTKVEVDIPKVYTK